MSLAADGSDPTAGWRLWESTPGHGERRRYYATRLGTTLTDEQLGRDLAMTVWADTPEERLRLLRRQAALLADEPQH